MTNLEKAEHLVRNHPANKELMELGFGCEVIVQDCNGKKHEAVFSADADYAGLIFKNGGVGSYVEEWLVKILGKPAHLESYIRVISKDIKEVFMGVNNISFSLFDHEGMITFSLDTGKPATEKDAELFVKLVGKV